MLTCPWLKAFYGQAIDMIGAVSGPRAVDRVVREYNVEMAADGSDIEYFTLSLSPSPRMTINWFIHAGEGPPGIRIALYVVGRDMFKTAYDIVSIEDAHSHDIASMCQRSIDVLKKLLTHQYLITYSRTIDQTGLLTIDGPNDDHKTWVVPARLAADWPTIAAEASFSYP